MPDDFVEEAIPSDEDLVLQAVGGGNLPIGVTVAGVCGILFGVFAAILGS